MPVLRTIALAALGAVAVWQSGCYSFTGASVPSHLKTVAIPLVDDQSGFGAPGIREQFTTALTDLFIKDNSLEVADRTRADAILEGSIVSITDAPAVVQQGETVTKRRITMTAKFAMQDMKYHRTTWEKSFSEWGDYDATGSGSSQQQTGLDDAVTKLTEDILLETVSGW